jgi:uncharacterized protein YcbX
MRQVTATVAELRVQPLKSARGILVSKFEVDEFGPVPDRRFMVVDSMTGMFVAQREDRDRGIAIPEMCQITTRIQGDMLVLSAPDMGELKLPLAMEPGFRSVRIWDDTVGSTLLDYEANLWITTYLRRFRRTARYASGVLPCKYLLVGASSKGKRRTPDGLGLTTFTDGWPLLVSSTGSLADLNERMAKMREVFDEPDAEPLGWDRFRPNIVLDCDEPYIEDRIMWMMAGDVQCVGTTQCVRCPTTRTNQLTAERGKEPLRTLSSYRRNPAIKPDGATPAGGVVFARNMRHVTTGTIRVGDPVVMMVSD